MEKETISATSRTYQLIKDKIIKNELDPRYRLNEIALAKELGISRTPVREALIMLEKEELIVRYNGDRGFYLKQYSLKDIYDLYEFRKIIELSLAGGIIKNITEEDIEDLGEILAHVRAIIANDKPAEALVRAIDFHLHLMRLSTDNQFMMNSLLNCYEKLVVISWTCHDHHACSSSASEHEKMMEALKRRDLDQFIEYTRNHIRSARDRIVDTLKISSEKLYIVR
jgi:DNA-binding GntR family transcriptional regulator